MSGPSNSSRDRVVAGRYQLGQRLGIGATSTVFEALDTLLERKVAVKMLAPGLLTAADGLNRFRTHARALAELNHPNVVSVYDWGTEEIRGVMVPFIVTEQLAGGTLREILDRGRRLTPSQALVVGLDCCRGLDHLHRRGIVHGQITPGNLFFGTDRRVKISDAGVGTMLSELVYGHDVDLDLSTARYASPEQAKGEPVNPRSDVYGLTLCLVESVTGEAPFGGDTASATLAARIDKLLPVSADLGALAAVLEKGGRPNPVERSSAAEFGRALVQAAEKLPRPAPLPLVGAPTSMFEAPLGSETTSELTRFQDPTGALRRDATGALTRDSTAGVRRVPTGQLPKINPSTTTSEVPIVEIDSSGAIRRDPTGSIRRSSDMTGELPKTRVIAVGNDTSDLRPRPKAHSGYATAPQRRVSPLIFVAVIGAAVAALLGYVAWQQLSKPSFAVPALVGRTQGEAENAVAPNGWKLDIRKENSDEQPTPGVVFKTEPVAGESLSKDSTFVIFVSTGPTLPGLPEIANTPSSEAVPVLVNLGLIVRSQVLEYSETVPLGIVMSWKVAAAPELKAGSQVVAGTEIDIVISQGPEPRVVPPVNDLTAEQFEAALKGLGLVPEALPVEFSESAKAGTVARSEPVPGEQVERGSTVKYAVSKGRDLITVPPLVGTLAEIDAALKAAGFDIVAIRGPETGVFVGATIDRKAITAGEQYSRGADVELVLLPPPTETSTPGTSTPGTSTPGTASPGSSSPPTTNSG